ncbi:MAG: tetratricopeptide repeat protein, partial [Planctomycetaceae bacterium]|nr:tetratricopeptide repeat protein [Planctomycetaceae bacterium]
AGGGPNATWKSIIDRSAARIGERFRDQPLVEAALRHTLGVTYFRLRELSTAQQHLSRALHLRSTTLGRDDAKTLQSQHALGYALLHMERFDEAAAQFREEHRVRLDRYGPTDPDTHEALERLVHALVDGGDYVAAEPLARSALQSAIECHGKVSLQAIDCARRMADVCRRLKRDRFHAELVEEALRMSSEFETQPLPGELLLPWAELLTRLDRPELSITFYEQALHWHEQQLGVDDPATITALGNLAVNQWLLLENYSAAIANLEEATTRMERRMGPGSPALLSYLRNLGECCLASGRHDRAAEVLSRAVRIAASNYSEGEPVRLRLLLSLGQAHKARGQIDNARQAFEEVLENSTESSRETQGFNRLARSAIEEIEKQSIQ